MIRKALSDQHSAVSQNKTVIQRSRGVLWRSRIPSLLMAVGWGLIASSVFASDAGTTSGELLKIPIGARAIGMGEAYTALANDSSALYWNPAGLSQVEQREATFMHSSLIESINYEHAAFALPGEAYSVAGSVSYLGYGSIAGYDNSGNPTGNVSAYSYAFNGGLARRINNNLSLGGGLEVIRETLAQDSAGTLAVNLGTLYKFSAHPWDGDYALGASILNLGPGLKFVDERDPLPERVQFGASAQHIKSKPIALTLDITHPNDNNTYLSLGTEYWFHDVMALRVGYTGANTTSNGVRLGFGFKLHNFMFDYAYGSFGDFGATHRISLTLRWGEQVQQLNKDERAILKEAEKFKQDGHYVQAILGYNEILDQDPDNNHILHKMIDTHEKMVQKDLNQAVTDALGPNSTDPTVLPTPEQAALADLVPGQQKAPAFGNNAGGYDPNDPLDLNNLPDVNNVDIANRSTSGSLSTPLPQPSDSSPDADAPALSPTDIYGQ